MMSETFEQVLTAAQAGASLNPAWSKFVKTTFFVPVLAPASGAGHTLRALAGKPTIRISEVRAQVDGDGGLLAALSGADVVRLVQGEAAIEVVLSDRSFEITGQRVAWLRKSIEASLAKAAQARAAAVPLSAATTPAAATVAAPARAAVVLDKPAPLRRPAGGPLDVAALKPRNVSIEKIGLQFFVPAAWRESPMSNGLRFHDDSTGTVLEAVGYVRPDVSLNKWVETRLAVVKHEMRYLKQAGDAYAINGAEWGERVTGRAIEFAGTVPGDAFESRCLVAFVRAEGIVVAITIRAPAADFEHNRALYKWFLTRVELDEMATPEPYRAPASGRGYADLDQPRDEPGVFGFSMQGRIGRLRALAYSLMVFMPMVVLAVALPILSPKGKFGAMGVIGVGVIVSMFFCLRLMVLRMHDVNLSGKWILGFMLAVGVGGAAGGPNFTTIGSIIFWLGLMIIYCFIPGTDGDNEFGEAPGPDSTLVKVGAGLFIVAQLLSLAGQSKMRSMDTRKGPDVPSTATSGRGTPVANKVWTSPDGGMTIEFPIKPDEEIVRTHVRERMGAATMRQFSAWSTNSENYRIQVLDIGLPPLDPDKTMVDLQAALLAHNDVLTAPPTALVFKGYPGRDIKAGRRLIRMVVVGSTVYIATADAGVTGESMQRASAFVESLALTQ
ncbi:DUF805 domain-containing protein [Massilia genomosp. 1]|uniref:DUF805 domain-containing protein n=1 Tax=Massilia genomosp. 1 TaxID=2609280 RepID=A0ABX0MRR2_9BURK|nr:DUF805 domain-containing protein [Massilia genomosp. 1]NHZ65111.1 DUF805 domain-containing protein [Massilia genomosp. 1]